jgi:NAD(P)-dependent dehydrogenase (short-subunit alcohol dehydrogenase family)
MRLLPVLRAATPARIVNVASIGQYPIDFTDVMLTRDYSTMRAYQQSKLAMIMFSFDLAEQLRREQITVNAMHPATFMPTKMVTRMGISPFSTIADGVDALMFVATSSKLDKVTGTFFDQKRQTRAHKQAYDHTARQHLWKLSEELTGL